MPSSFRFVAEKWVMRTEELGSAREAHRDLPKGGGAAMEAVFG
jgi:hypothetical protein